MHTVIQEGTHRSHTPCVKADYYIASTISCSQMTYSVRGWCFFWWSMPGHWKEAVTVFMVVSLTVSSRCVFRSIWRQGANMTQPRWNCSVDWLMPLSLLFLWFFPTTLLQLIITWKPEGNSYHNFCFLCAPGKAGRHKETENEPQKWDNQISVWNWTMASEEYNDNHTTSLFSALANHHSIKCVGPKNVLVKINWVFCFWFLHGERTHLLIIELCHCCVNLSLVLSVINVSLQNETLIKKKMKRR